MLTLTCEVDRRSRPQTGGVRYGLKAVDAQFALPGDPAAQGLDLNRASVSVYDYTASSRVLEDLRRDPINVVGMDAGASLITVTPTGALYLSIFLSLSGHPLFLSDLDTVLEKAHLLASLTIGPEMEGPQRLALERWLQGTRFEDDENLWTYKVPELGLVLRR